jgi:hypothetical protein
MSQPVKVADVKKVFGSAADGHDFVIADDILEGATTLINDVNGGRASDKNAKLIAGMRQLQKDNIMLGFQPAREMLVEMVKMGAPEGSDDRRDLLAALDALSETAERGSFRADFVDRHSKQPQAAYIAVKLCDRKYNVVEQYEVIRPHVTDAAWKEVMDKAGAMVLFTRMAYAMITSQKSELLARIAALLKVEPAQIAKLNFNEPTATLYVLPEWKLSLGIFIVNERHLPRE